MGSTKKRGETVEIHSPGSLLHGIKAKFIKRSQATSICTVELLESRGAYSVGDRVHIKQWEMK